MANSLQEFLVTLKYRSEGKESYLAGIKGAESTVMRLGKALIAGGTALGLFFEKYAARMEQVGFVARRTGTHVKDLMALEQAGASLGSSAEGAKSALEGLAKFMNTTPGASAWLRGIGVQTKDARGHALDTVQVMKNLGSALRSMPIWQANQFAQVAGIDYNTMMAMRDKNFSAMIDKFKKPLRGAHLDKTAHAANQAMIAGRVLGMKKEALESKAALPALNAFTAADAKTQGLSTDLLGLAKALGEASVGVMLFKGVFKAMAAGSVAEGVAGGAAGSVAEGKVGKIGKLLGILGWLSKLSLYGGAAYGGIETGKALDKIPVVHQELIEATKGIRESGAAKEIRSGLRDLSGFPLLGSLVDKLDLGPAIVRARTESSLSRPFATHEPPKNPSAPTTDSKTSSVNNMNVTINVQGAKDPHETARKVKEEIRMAVHNSSMAAH